MHRLQEHLFDFREKISGCLLWKLWNTIMKVPMFHVTYFGAAQCIKPSFIIRDGRLSVARNIWGLSVGVDVTILNRPFYR